MKSFAYKSMLCMALSIALFVIDASAQISLSGDAKMRPRWDLNDRTGAGKTLSRDVYFMYRARLRMKADIGEGWSFKTLLGHNGVGEFAGKFAKGDLPDILGVEQSNLSNDGARRATIDFMEVYINYETEQEGFKVGLFPVGSVGNPIYDVHYYPLRMVDIPYFIFNNDGIYGMSAFKKWGKTTISSSFYVDDDRGGYLEDAAGNVTKDLNDRYSFELGVVQKIGAIQWQFQSIVTLAQDTVPRPRTFSLKTSGWKAGQTNLVAQFVYSTQNTTSPTLSTGVCEGQFGVPDNKYRAMFFRLTASRKIGENTFRAWLDLVNRKDLLDTGNIDNQFVDMWIDYSMILAKTDKGRVVLSPRIRPIWISRSDDILQSRQKIELDLDIFF